MLPQFTKTNMCLYINSNAILDLVWYIMPKNPKDFFWGFYWTSTINPINTAGNIPQSTPDYIKLHASQNKRESLKIIQTFWVKNQENPLNNVTIFGMLLPFRQIKSRHNWATNKWIIWHIIKTKHILKNFLSWCTHKKTDESFFCCFFLFTGVNCF